jgi:radical SAM superfamily enzyme YgiQ (UPF0313 family)
VKKIRPGKIVRAVRYEKEKLVRHAGLVGRIFLLLITPA